MLFAPESLKLKYKRLELNFTMNEHSVEKQMLDFLFKLQKKQSFSLYYQVQ